VNKTIHSLDNNKLKMLLRQVREEAGLKQTELAERLQRRQAWVSSYERGERRLDVLELRQVVAALGLDFLDFMARLEAALRSGE
jgi:transcriptional regulator with XRE-family HTH domain